ncbi:MAG: hypothetical protein BIFFINMI_02740 [Phycisphaerae bacterium]|nr:hypothetical protein [Phycisphaerae bacterium]
MRPSARRVGLRTILGRRLASGWAVFLWAWALLVATHAPYPFHTTVEVGGVGLDKIVHGLLYAPLAATVAGFLARRGVRTFARRHRLWLMPAILLAFATLDELTQSLPDVNRNASLADWIGDAASILLVAVVAAGLAWRARRSRVPSG